LIDKNRSLHLLEKEVIQPKERKKSVEYLLGANFATRA